MADMKINSNTGTVDYYDGADPVYSLPSATGVDGNILKISSNAMAFSNDVPYVPSTSSNWTGTYTLMAAAIDELASRLKTAEGEIDTLQATLAGVTSGSGGGTGATATASINEGAVNDVSITNAGSGYTSAPNVSFSGGAGSGAQATAAVSNGQVSSITITNGGSGYTSAPTVSIG